MPSLKTNYLGLELKSPIIIGSSGLTKKIDNLKIAEQKGAGAVVLKSFFEEQIDYETNETAAKSLLNYPEADEYIKVYLKQHSLNFFTESIKNTRKALRIPVIASLCCSNTGEWSYYAKAVEKAGACGLELNMIIPAHDANQTATDIENKYCQIVEEVKSSTNLKIGCKISNKFTNITNFIKQLQARGIDDFILFNKFFSPVIDTDNERIISAPLLSTNADAKHSLRDIAVISGLLPNTKLSASTGVFSANDAIQLMLAGASTVQLCSVLYQKGFHEITAIYDGIAEWMDEKSYDSIDDFRGKLSYSNVGDAQLYERFQFIKYFTNLE